MELAGIEPGKGREQLWPERKEKSQMLDSCYNTVRSNAAFCATRQLCRLHEGRIVGATGKTRLMVETVQEHCK